MSSVLITGITMGTIVCITCVYRICQCIENCINTVYKRDKFNE